MGSISQPSLRSELLERTHILKQILNHVDDYAAEFDLVDYDSLKEEVLKPVLAETFDPETQIRGFLKTFRHTLVYKAAISNIENKQLKDQIGAFVDGKDAKKVVGNEGFHVAAHKSPPVHHHFSLLTELQKLFFGVLELKEVVEDVFHPQHKHVKDLPVVFEGTGDDKVVEVSAH
tara:strand:+ start:2591 stop:3115 length:525 start_codon:yes stop_codon:yes gene_type:complete